MPGLDDLYREIILDHYRSPRNRGELETPPATKAEGFNPLCGDEIVVYVETETNNAGDEIVSDVAIGGQGCSISQASASMMSAAVKGKTLAEVATLTGALKSMMSIEVEGIDSAIDADVSLGDLQALSGVVKFPVRIKCATLAWNTLAEAITPTD